MSSFFGAGEETEPSAPPAPGLPPRPTGLGPEAVPAASPSAVSSAVAHWADLEPEDHKVLYWGLNEDSRASESRIVKDRADGVVIDGARKDGKLVMPGPDGEPVEIDLTTQEGVMAWLERSGVGAVRADGDGQALETEGQARERVRRLQELMTGRTADGTYIHGLGGGIDTSIRDDVAELVGYLQRAERGEIAIDRLIVSGHCDGEGRIFNGQPAGENLSGAGIGVQQIELLMKEFPHAAEGVKDLLMAGCNTNKASKGGAKQYRGAFPGLESVSGYEGKAPTPEMGSIDHIRRFLQTSQGDASPAPGRYDKNLVIDRLPPADR